MVLRGDYSESGDGRIALLSAEVVRRFRLRLRWIAPTSCEPLTAQPGCSLRPKKFGTHCSSSKMEQLSKFPHARPRKFPRIHGSLISATRCSHPGFSIFIFTAGLGWM